MSEKGIGTAELSGPADGSCLNRSEQASDPVWRLGLEDVRISKEVRILAVSTTPLALTFLLQSLLIAINLLFVGHVGRTELAAAGLGCLTAKVTGWGVFQGLATALDTLCPQAYGASCKQTVGLHVQRMTLLLLCTSVPIVVCWYHSRWFLGLLVSDPQVCDLAQTFLRVLSLGCPGVIFFECGKRILQAQGHFSAGLYTLAVCVPFGTGLTWCLVKYFDYGFVGAAISLSVARSLMPLGLLGYAYLFTDISECYSGIDRNILKNWMPMVRLALPSFVMLEADYVGFEILTLLAGLNGIAHLSAQTLLCTIVSLTFQAPFSLGIAASTRVAHQLGCGSIQSAKAASKAAVALGGLIGLCSLVFLLSFRCHIASLFASDWLVVRLITDVLPLCGIFALVDAFSGVLNGIIQGVGRPHVGAWAQLLSHYAFGIPLSAMLALGLDWGLMGIWVGLTLTLLLVSIMEGLYVYYLNWDGPMEDAMRRNAAEEMLKLSQT
ncbi:MATE efflux family protein [Thozetella sp. PMI_491]|nr:MATE efflux family protein [Thozetella sp. PMI_491]